MRIVVLVVILAFFLGCETADYYTNPNSQGYREQGLGAICEQCGREFRVSAYQVNNVENVTCPYDGHAQNTKFAYNRYVYAAQQQQQASIQQFQARQLEIRKEYDEKMKSLSIRNQQELKKESNNTSCSPDGSGGFYCRSW